MDHLDQFWTEKRQGDSNLFGFTIAQQEFEDFQCHLLMCLCHMAIDTTLGPELGQVLPLLQSHADKTHGIVRVGILETLRNLFYHSANHGQLDPDCLALFWDLGLRYHQVGGFSDSNLIIDTIT